VRYPDIAELAKKGVVKHQRTAFAGKSRKAAHLRIELPTWHWQYCRQSGWSFQVGMPSLEKCSLGKKSRAFVKGEFCLHVFAAKWHIERLGKKVIGYRSSEDRINTWFSKLDGILLRSILLQTDGRIKGAIFARGYKLHMKPYAWARDSQYVSWLDRGTHVPICGGDNKLRK